MRRSSSLKRFTTGLGEILLLMFIIAVLLGQVIGQPVFLSYVETGSMEPTIDAGDGFIAIPTELSGEVRSGDVVIFEAEQIRGGGLTTHRVVGQTDGGYVTRGDANPFTDQDGGEPPVMDGQIVAKAWQVGGNVVVIPKLGAGVVLIQGLFEAFRSWLSVTLDTRVFSGTTGIVYVLLGFSILAYLVDLAVVGRGNPKDREQPRNRGDRSSVPLILLLLAGVLVAAATAAMVVPGGTQQIGFVSAEFESENPAIVPQGSSESLQYVVPNAGLVPVHAYVEPASEGVDVEPRHVFVGGRDVAELTVTLHAPDETGYYRRFVAEHRYLAVLPEPVIRDLYELHPWAPIVAIDVLLGGGLYAIGLIVIGTGHVRIRNRSRRSSPSLTARLKEVLY